MVATGWITAQVDYLPVFKPNDYFWEHHWRKGEEEKWEAFARAVRQIIADHGGFKTSELLINDKFKYKKLLKEAWDEKRGKAKKQ